MTAIEGSIEQTIHALNNREDCVRLQAIDDLARIGDRHAVEALRAKYGRDHSTDEPESQFYLTIAIALVELGYYNALANIIASDATFVRPRTLTALRKFGKRRIVDALIKALNGGDGGVRFWVADALGSLGDKRAVEPLIQALQGIDNHARQMAADALGRLKDIRAIPALEDMIQGDTEPECRRIAGIAVKLIRG